MGKNGYEMIGKKSKKKKSITKLQICVYLLKVFLYMNWKFYKKEKNLNKKELFSKIFTFLIGIILQLCLIGSVTAFIFVGFEVMQYPCQMYGAILAAYPNDYNADDLKIYLGLFKMFFMWAMIAMVCDTSMNFFQQLLQIYWRYTLTSNLQYAYLNDEKVFYDLIIIKKEIDNPDERICEDAENFTTLLSSIYQQFTNSIVSIFYYSFLCFKGIGWQGPVFVYAYFTISSIISFFLTLPITKFWYKQEKKEGNFRFSHSTFRKNVESIAFYKGGMIEYTKNQKFLKKITINKVVISFFSIFLKMHMSIFGYIGAVANYLVVLIVAYIFHDFTTPDMPPADVTTLISLYAMELLNLVYGFTAIIQVGQDIGKMSGLVVRLAEFFGVLAKIKNDINEEIKNPQVNKKTIISEDSEKIVLENVNIFTPQNRSLLKDLNFEITKNDRIMIEGENGCGKTTLLRVLCGLFQSYTGTIAKPKEECFYFMSQTPYLFIGSLKEQILYPFYADKKELKFEDELFKEVLDELKIGYIYELHGLKKEKNWDSILSGGEKQKLSFSRFLFHFKHSRSEDSSLRFLIMDESTSSMDKKSEKFIMEKIQKLDLCFLSVSHRLTQKAYHNKKLEIKENKRCVLTKL